MSNSSAIKNDYYVKFGCNRKAVNSIRYYPDSHAVRFEIMIDGGMSADGKCHACHNRRAYFVMNMVRWKFKVDVRESFVTVELGDFGWHGWETVNFLLYERGCIHDVEPAVLKT